MPRAVSFARHRAGAILLVDDYDDARAVARETLEGAGHTVIEASNGQQALNILVSLEQKVAMIVLDLQMPVMDGWQFIRLLHSYVGLASIPVLIVTAHEPRLQAVSHQSVFGCLQSPYSAQQLLSMVGDCMSSPPSDNRALQPV